MAQTRKQRILGDVKKARRQRTIITIVIIIVVLAVSIVAAIIVLSPHPQPILLSGGKPEFLYVGADYCPYCAAERWSVIVALSKFGNFSGLTYMASASSPEVYPDTPTLSFGTATYQSNYNITFVSVEEQHRDRSAFQSPSQQDQNALNAYDPSGTIPFIDIANKYVDNSGSQYSVSVLSGLNWTEIGSQLNNPSSPVAQAIDGAANTMIRAICKVDGGKPSSLCGLPLAPPAQATISVAETIPFSALNTTLIGTPLSPTSILYKQLTGVSDSTLSTVDSPSGITALTPESRLTPEQGEPVTTGEVLADSTLSGGSTRHA